MIQNFSPPARSPLPSVLPPTTTPNASLFPPVAGSSRRWGRGCRDWKGRQGRCRPFVTIVLSLLAWLATEMWVYSLTCCSQFCDFVTIQ